jgi:protein-disulfide isomerase
MLQKINKPLVVTAVFLALLLMGCNSDNSQKELIPLGSESSTKEIVATSSNAKIPVNSESRKLREQFIRESARNYPSIGSKYPKVIVVEFSDYTCGYCRKAHSVSKKIMEKYKDKVQWVFVDFPLDDPPFADSPAHLLGNCLLSQNKTMGLFWKFYHEAFVRDEMSKLDSVIQLGKDLGMDREMVLNCIQNRDKQNPIVEMISKKQRKAKELGIRATPSFFIGRKQVQGYLPFNKFEKIILQELKQN